jgi:hypothetical protein
MRYLQNLFLQLFLSLLKAPEAVLIYLNIAATGEARHIQLVGPKRDSANHLAPDGCAPDTQNLLTGQRSNLLIFINQRKRI